MKNDLPKIEVSIVMPCLNEEETIGTCINKALGSFDLLAINGEVVIADNGSIDKSVEIAESLGARVTHQQIKGYGSALMTGIEEALGDYIIMGDCDDSYDFSEIEGFIEPLRNGYDMVMGTRIKGTIKHGAMPWLHKYIGNPFLTWFLNRLFLTGISDAHCGMRSFTKEAYKKMCLQTTGMEFASEMVIKASKAKLRITEIPITLHPDGRTGKPHLRSFRDGWRHLRLMLLYSPTHLFLIPGVIMMALGLVPLIALLGGVIFIGGYGYNIHFSLLGSLFTILGFQVVTLGLYAKAYAFKEHFEEDKLIVLFYNYFSLERGFIFGLLIFLIGFIFDLYVLMKWIESDFGALLEVSKASFATTFMVIGVQIVFSSFLLSMLDIKRKHSEEEE